VNSWSHFSFRCIAVQLTGYASSALLSLLGLLLILNNPASLVAQEPTQTSLSPGAIRVNVDRVSVGVTVTGLHGNFVKGLRREDFRVFDNGVEQPVTGFLSLEEPAQVVLLLECGPAALFLKKSEFQAADTLLDSISPVDRVAIVSYSKSPDLVVDFTVDKSEARTALRGMNFMGGVGELNLASSIAATLDWLAVLPGKKTIVLLSSGVDTSPAANWQTIEEKIKASDVRILAVSVAEFLRKYPRWSKLSPDEREARKYVKEVFTEADQSLRALSEVTGGRVYFPKTQREFNRAYTEISHIVRQEYSLEFAPLSLDGRMHSLKVTAKHSGYRVEYRQAYLALPPASH
jgi:Ca-activated chloride channel family protein